MSDKTPDADRTPDELRQWLSEIADLAALLPDAAITRTPHVETSRPTPSSRPPMRLDIVHLLDERDKSPAGVAPGMGWTHGMQFVDPDRIGLLPYLDGWVRDLEATLLDEHDQLPDEVPEVPTVTACCQWLAKHAELAAETLQWPEVVYGLRRVRQAVRGATEGIRGHVEKPVPCGRCGAGVLARVAGSKPLWECDACGRQETVQAVTITQAARIIGVPRESLKRWTRRPGFLQPITDTPGRKLYDLGQLRALVAEERLRGAS